MALSKRARWALAAAALLVAAAAAQAQALDPSPPASPVKLVFVHHSTGENWLRDTQEGDGTAGGLGAALAANHYFVSDTNYGWGPSGIGDRTDIGNWWEWFRGPDSAEITAALYAESGQNCSYTRLETDPGGANQVVMFKSCFPNSNLGGSPSDPVPPIGENPLKGEDSGSEHHTIANAKGIYLDLLNYFSSHPEKLFVIVCAPPLRQADTGPEQAANARALNDWLVEHLLDGYPGNNVAVFDFYNVLTSNGGNPDVNDLGAAGGNHHRWRSGQIEHVRNLANDTSAYPSGDSHPSSAGGQKASGEFPALLNIAYHCWKGTGGCPRAPGCTVTCSATVPDWAPPQTAVDFSGSATVSAACTDVLSYEWDFGDGSAHSHAQNPSHTYAAVGTYTWTLSTSSGTAKCTKSGTLLISSSADCTITSCEADTQPADGAQPGEEVAFFSYLSYPGCAGQPTYDWDFGDGSSHSTQEWPGHTYATYGTYHWVLKATVDGAACTHSGTLHVVQPPAVTGVQKMGSPFRLKLTGSHFEDGVAVLIWPDQQAWSNTQRKSDTQILLKGGASLKAKFPKGQPVTLHIVNPDGGRTTATYTRP
jgi:hypothetical protein